MKSFLLIIVFVVSMLTMPISNYWLHNKGQGLLNPQISGNYYRVIFEDKEEICETLTIRMDSTFSILIISKLKFVDTILSTSGRWNCKKNDNSDTIYDVFSLVLSTYETAKYDPIQWIAYPIDGCLSEYKRWIGYPIALYCHNCDTLQLSYSDTPFIKIH